MLMHNPGAAEPFAIYWLLWRHFSVDGICMCTQTVKHRWLDESAPMKLSPLREALEAGKTLLGDELPPLDLGAAQVPNLPEIIPRPPDAAEAAALDDVAQPDQAAGAAPDQDTPMRDAQPDQAAGASEIVPPPDQNTAQVQAAQPDEDMGLSQEAAVPPLEHVQLLAEEQLETPELAPGPPSTKSSGRGRGRSRNRGGRGRSSSSGRGRGRGRKRKVSPTPKGVSIAPSHLHDSTFAERHITAGRKDVFCPVHRQRQSWMHSLNNRLTLSSPRCPRLSR